MDLGSRLSAAAARHPGAPAVVDGDRTATYGELDAASATLAGVLAARDAGRGRRVGVLLDKSLEAVVALYGVLRAGAAYVPLDTKAPAARLGAIVGDAGATAIVTSPRKLPMCAEVVAAAGGPAHVVVVGDGELDGTAGDALAAAGVTVSRFDEAASEGGRALQPIGADDLAYVLYTSGSTGRPKGVMLTHENAAAFVDWAVADVGLRADDRVSSHAPFHFDLSVFDLYATATAGACLVLVPATISVFPSQVARFIRDQRITVWYSVPSVLTMLVERGGLARGDLPRLRTVIFAGEVFPVRFLRGLMDLLPHARFLNWYGPTETNVCTAYEVATPPAPDGPEIPIGKAIAGVDAYVVDDLGEPVPPGTTGELLVRGPTVMQGYWGDAERTGRALVPDVRPGRPRGVAYRTGDLVHAEPDGTLRYIGRRDHQIKTRGHRVELGDIETAFLAHPSVHECAVVPVPDVHVTNLIRAVVVSDVDELSLRRHGMATLPPYMVPDEFVLVDALPKTSTGKIDRQALRADAEEP